MSTICSPATTRLKWVGFPPTATGILKHPQKFVITADLLCFVGVIQIEEIMRRSTLQCDRPWWVQKWLWWQTCNHSYFQASTEYILQRGYRTFIYEHERKLTCKHQVYKRSQVAENWWHAHARPITVNLEITFKCRLRVICSCDRVLWSESILHGEITVYSVLGPVARWVGSQTRSEPSSGHPHFPFTGLYYIFSGSLFSLGQAGVFWTPWSSESVLVTPCNEIKFHLCQEIN